jgi:hypothetical protein
LLPVGIKTAELRIFMINPIALKNDILFILASQLGTYTFPDKTTGQAIAVLPDPELGWQYPEQGTKPFGLEVVIKQPYPETSPLLGGDRSHSYKWEIHLKQWDTTKSLFDVVDLLVTELPSKYYIERVSPIPASDKLLVVEQCKIYLKEWAISARES